MAEDEGCGRTTDGQLVIGVVNGTVTSAKEELLVTLVPVTSTTGLVETVIAGNAAARLVKGVSSS